MPKVIHVKLPFASHSMGAHTHLHHSTRATQLKKRNLLRTATLSLTEHPLRARATTSPVLPLVPSLPLPTRLRTAATCCASHAARIAGAPSNLL